MKEKTLKKLLRTLFVFIFLNSCTNIKIKDDPWCADAGVFGAECFYTLSDKSFTLDQYHWNKLRVGQICSATENPGEGFKNLKVAIEKLCSDTFRCTEQQQAAVSNVVKRLKIGQETINRVQPRARLLRTE